VLVPNKGGRTAQGVNKKLQPAPPPHIARLWADSKWHRREGGTGVVDMGVDMVIGIVVIDMVVVGGARLVCSHLSPYVGCDETA